MGSDFRSDSRPSFESLESRLLLSVWLDNGQPVASANYWAVNVDAGGSVHQTQLGANLTDTMYEYNAYLYAGPQVIDFSVVGTDPVQTNSSTATSSVTVNLGPSGSIAISITSIVPPGSRSFINYYSFSATGFDMTGAKFFQYMDSDILSVNDDVLTTTGSIATKNLLLTTIDPATMIQQAQLSGNTTGADLTGFGADIFAQLRSAIQSGAYSCAAGGTIDTIDLPLNLTYPTIGPCYGPGDITTTLQYTMTSSSVVGITTLLGLSAVGNIINNALPTTDPNYFAVSMDSGGSTMQTDLAGRNVVHQYLGYIEAAGVVYDLSAIATPPVLTGQGSATSSALLNLGGGSSLDVTIDSSIPAGTGQLVTTYSLKGTGVDLTAVRLFQYLDPQIGTIATDEVLTVLGSIATNNLALTTMDQASFVKDTLSAGSLTNASLTGFGADVFADLQTAILAGGYSPAATGTIDTTDLPPGLFFVAGAGYGPADVTTVLAFSPTDSSFATITTVLEVQLPDPRRAILIVPDFLGSMPTPETMQDFLLTPGAAPGTLEPEYFLNMYQPLIDSLESMGYNSYSNIFFVGYDWRLPVAPADGTADGTVALAAIDYNDSTFQYGAEYLEYWINRAQTFWNIVHPGLPFQVDIVAHGMGGLVTRSVLQSDSALAGAIGNFVSIGTPNLGQVGPLAWLDAGTNLENLLEQHGTEADLPIDAAATGILATLWNAAKSYGYSGSTIGQWAPGLKTLLPAANTYVTSSSIGAPPDMTAYANGLLADLNAGVSSIVGRQQGTVFASGQGVQTMTGLNYIVGSQRDVLSGLDGDGVVSVASALLPGLAGTQIYQAAAGVRHRELPSDGVVQRMALRVLGVNNGDLTNFVPVLSSTISSVGNYIVGYVDSADFLLVDSAGRRLGYTTATGELNEMPGAYFSGAASRQFFFIPAGALTGDVTLQLTGKDLPVTGNILYHDSGNILKQELALSLGTGLTQQIVLAKPVEVAPVDNTTLVAADLPTVWGLSSDYEFTVAFFNPAGVDVASIGAGDIVVTNPGGAALVPQVIAKSTSLDGQTCTVFLRMSAPAPYWQSTDAGEYHISLPNGAVTGFGEEILGEFNVELAANKWHIGGGTKKQTIDLGATVLTATWRGPGGGWIILNDSGVANALDIEVHDTSGKSSLTLKGQATIDSIVAYGSMKAISAAGASLAGDIIVSGSLGKLVFGDVNGARIAQHVIDVGAAARRAKALSVSLGRVSDLTLTSGSPITSLSVIDWNDTADQTDLVQAPSIRALYARGIAGSVAGDFQADLLVTRSGLRKAQIMGGLSGAAWNVTGNIGSLAVGGDVLNSTIRGSGNMGSLTMRGTVGSDFLAGISAGVVRHAALPGDFVNASVIRKIKIVGLGPAGLTSLRFYQDSNFSASALGTVDLLNLDLSSGSSGLYVLGLAVPTPFKRITGIDTLSGQKWTWPADVYTGPADFIHIV